jgi:hypothetical protein
MPNAKCRTVSVQSSLDATVLLPGFFPFAHHLHIYLYGYREKVDLSNHIRTEYAYTYAYTYSLQA